MFYKLSVFETLGKFTEKYLCQSLYLSKTANLSKKETLAQVFSCEFCGIFKKVFFAEHDTFDIILKKYFGSESRFLELTDMILNGSHIP